jgi:lipopolysaccharide/colanic/teichoic acid biosynthesis glycosyltransferase
MKADKRSNASRRAQLALKRSFDLFVAIATLSLLSPFMLLIGVAIKLTDGGSVFYVQDRVGRDGKVFRCYKFRTMVEGAESQGLGIEVAKDDQRVTPVGSYLRQWTLDEIPQLFNVLGGAMSIVGPRPTVPSQVARYTAKDRRRLEVKPGMAGWAWIHGRNRLSWRERIDKDIWYVDHWSFALDMRILIAAVGLLLKREGLYGRDGIAHDFE